MSPLALRSGSIDEPLPVLLCYFELMVEDPNYDGEQAKEEASKLPARHANSSCATAPARVPVSGLYDLGVQLRNMARGPYAHRKGLALIWLESA